MTYVYLVFVTAVQVDFGTDWERHLAFLIECRASFASFDEMKVGNL